MKILPVLLKDRERYPAAEAKVGKLIREGMNHVYFLAEWGIFTFPTKHEWFDTESDMTLILQSALELQPHAERMSDQTFLLPRPGVGAGHLPWEKVEAVIAPILPDNVLVITH